MTIPEYITRLRSLMAERNIDAYVIPSSDYHQSEYVGEYFKSRAFITGFAGSAGTVVFTQDKAGLWTDGRYFIQAEKELIGSGISLYKSGNPEVPSIDKFLNDVLPQNGTLGFDGRLLSVSEVQRYIHSFGDKNIRIEDRFDLIDSIWENRPPLSKEPVFLLSETYSGESTSSKLEHVRNEMRKTGATVHLLASLDDIAWLLNFRGNDVAYTPVVLCYAVITFENIHLFIEQEKLSNKVQATLQKDGVIFHPYNDVYRFVKGWNADEVVLVDSERLNYALYNSIPATAKRVEKPNPTILFKSTKNEIEIANIKKAHVKDAVAHTKFMYWIKTNYDKQTITELSASDKLESLRAEQEHFLGPSFAPICAYGPHAAMCHYSSSKETDVILKEGSLFLTDTGGHYLEGSTDITRTIALGKIDKELKCHFTNVLRGNLALSKAKFLYGCTGENLDILARQHLWNMGLDYKHGTGHGIGYLLSIHEGPCSIKWQYRQTPVALEDGMVLSDEPGVYVENSHGIRLENELLVRKEIQNEYGQFMRFEVLTYVPFDLDAIDVSLLSEEEKAQLNAYHQSVYEIVSPHLTDVEKEWLKHYTRAI